MDSYLFAKAGAEFNGRLTEARLRAGDGLTCFAGDKIG